MSHIVLMKPRDDLSPAEREALVAAFDRAVRAVPAIRGVRIGRRATHGAGYEAHTQGTADYIAILDFDDLAALQTYLRHPAHAELGARLGRSLRWALVFDFEVGGLEDLRAGRFF